MRASVLIPTFERGSMLLRSLPYLARQSVPATEFEIVVIDDGSTRDDAGAALTRLALPNALVLEQPHRGSAAARNAGLARARGDVIVFLDDDAFVGPHFLEEHLRLHARRQGAIVAGGIVQVRSIPEVIDERPGLAAYHRHPFPGGNASVRAQHLARVGGFDDDFETYGWHDQELGERLMKTGLQRRFAWRAPIYHYKAPGYDVDLRMQLDRERHRGRMGARFYRKHPTWSVGVTTKLHPVVQRIERIADRLFDVDGLQRTVESAKIVGDRVRPWKRALLRAHVEIAAGRAELTRLETHARRTRVAAREFADQSGAVAPTVVPAFVDADAPGLVLSDGPPLALPTDSSTARETSPNVG